jgi:hypothetical protein
MSHRNRHFLPAYIFGMLILIGASMPTSGLRKIRRMNDLFSLAFSDTSLHFFGFGVFAALLAWGYYRTKSSAVLLKSGVVAFSFGLFIELYQLFLPHRFFSLHDLAADGAGTVLLLVLFWGIVIKRNL